MQQHRLRRARRRRAIGDVMSGDNDDDDDDDDGDGDDDDDCVVFKSYALLSRSA